jgi:hypothetical protein
MKTERKHYTAEEKVAIAADGVLPLAKRALRERSVRLPDPERPHRQVEEKQKRIEFLENKVQTKDEVLAEPMAEHIAFKKVLGSMFTGLLFLKGSLAARALSYSFLGWETKIMRGPLASYVFGKTALSLVSLVEDSPHNRFPRKTKEGISTADKGVLTKAPCRRTSCNLSQHGARWLTMTLLARDNFLAPTKPHSGRALCPKWRRRPGRGFFFCPSFAKAISPGNESLRHRGSS